MGKRLLSNTGSFHSMSVISLHLCISVYFYCFFIWCCIFKFISTCITAFCWYYNWEHLLTVFHKRLWFEYKGKVLIFVHLNCFWSSYGGKLLVRLMIFKFNSFGWWLLSELTHNCFIPNISLSVYIVGLSIPRVV